VKQSPQLDEANAKSSGIRQAVREAVASVEVVPEVAVELPVADAAAELTGAFIKSRELLRKNDGQASGVSKPARSESSKKRREQTAEELREVAEKKARIALAQPVVDRDYPNRLVAIIPANRVRQRRKVAEGFASAIERGVRAEEMREPVNDFARDAGERLEAKIFVKEDAATEGGWSKYLKEVSRIGKNLLDAGGITQILERQRVSLEQVASHHCTGEWLKNMKINDEAVPYTDRWRSLHQRLTRELMRQCGESERGDGDDEDGKELAIGIWGDELKMATGVFVARTRYGMGQSRDDVGNALRRANSWALELCRRCWESSVARREDGGFDTDMRYYNNHRRSWRKYVQTRYVMPKAMGQVPSAASQMALFHDDDYKRKYRMGVRNSMFRKVLKPFTTRRDFRSDMLNQTIHNLRVTNSALYAIEDKG
ncbi:hypothetical protein FOZ63_012622, partial [Perkinsus olseni]